MPIAMMKTAGGKIARNADGKIIIAPSQADYEACCCGALGPCDKCGHNATPPVFRATFSNIVICPGCFSSARFPYTMFYEWIPTPPNVNGVYLLPHRTSCCWSLDVPFETPAKLFFGPCGAGSLLYTFTGMRVLLDLSESPLFYQLMIALLGPPPLVPPNGWCDVAKSPIADTSNPNELFLLFFSTVYDRDDSWCAPSTPKTVANDPPGCVEGPALFMGASGGTAVVDIP